MSSPMAEALEQSRQHHYDKGYQKGLEDAVNQIRYDANLKLFEEGKAAGRIEGLKEALEKIDKYENIDIAYLEIKELINKQEST
jgi:flagellar biosynthesis/type III secretory pathway protein FliH